MIVFLKLVLAHFLGDFVFQPSRWVQQKKELGIKSKWLYIHAGVHLILSLLLVMDLGYLVPILVIAVSHLAIDAVKITFRSRTGILEPVLFIADQLAHLLVLFLVFKTWEDPAFLKDIYPEWDRIILVSIALILVTSFANILIHQLMKTWSGEVNEEEGHSLNNAGKWIGILERLFVFLFVVYDQWQALGFLLAAKSVFRFGDLKEAKDRKRTEYILLGTLVSFGLAICIGLAFNYVSGIMIE